MNPFVKPPDPLGRREQGAALSEKQISLRSNATASIAAGLLKAKAAGPCFGEDAPGLESDVRQQLSRRLIELPQDSSLSGSERHCSPPNEAISNLVSEDATNGSKMGQPEWTIHLARYYITRMTRHAVRCD
jgi:hypothetical protein